MTSIYPGLFHTYQHHCNSLPPLPTEPRSCQPCTMSSWVLLPPVRFGMRVSWCWVCILFDPDEHRH